jgi:antitoxin component YwqK of YwqJK toxin-antitoxin module
MKQTITILTCFIMGVQATSAQKVITNYWGYTTKIRQQYQVDANGAENGFWKSFSNDGKLLEHYNYLHGQQHGKQLKYFRGFSDIEWCMGQPLEIRNYDNGKMLSEEVYKCKNGKPSLWYKTIDNAQLYEYSLYYDNGKMKEHTKRDKAIKNSKMIHEVYHENGKLALKGAYTEDHKKIGIWYGFNQSGDTTEIADYFYDITLNSKTYNDNKQLIKDILLSEDYETMTLTQYDESGNISKKYVYRAKPMTKDFSCNGVAFNSWKEYILKSGECSGRNIYDNKDYSMNTLKINFINGEPTDTIKRFLGMCCDVENDYINSQQYEYVVVMNIPCEHCRSQRCFETTQDEIDELRAQSLYYKNEKLCSKLSGEVFDLRNSVIATGSKVYAGWINKVKREIYEDYLPKYNKANKEYQEYRNNGVVSQSYIDACIQFKEILKNLISLYEKCDALDKEASDEIKDAVKKATTIEEKKRLLGVN